MEPPVETFTATVAAAPATDKFRLARAVWQADAARGKRSHRDSRGLQTFNCKSQQKLQTNANFPLIRYGLLHYFLTFHIAKWIRTFPIQILIIDPVH
ncbi:hypothetical protein [Paraburkholderia solisilvae]|uniref:hypothetical protein n=1 Tax=Paraburkholderia solisilvae TaxID=624376 RepID=UPI0015818CAE|nr:hypothetical protein [Paraburkholderia solisilvae]